MKEIRIKEQRKNRRLTRTRKKLLFRRDKVRLSIFRSNKHMYAQLIDDVSNVTLAAVSEKDVKANGMNKTQKAVELAKILASKAKEKNIQQVVFDKGSYRYHGRVKAFAETAREGGLQF